ncbi:hypothetical protein F5X71_14865 [Nocardia brasiliensis]|uniref:Uncharacterized protein n=1 Tax=Nocardia brasiliensis TaxID=37326 RepID=A0A6G9XR57_NOCBR|nr:hypothetical protein [Nocardia brasiliensis]QIS03431.1 hypothetical protein F5X71_14865 [Nocardia brasiliensis]
MRSAPEARASWPSIGMGTTLDSPPAKSGPPEPRSSIPGSGSPAWRRCLEFVFESLRSSK